MYELTISKAAVAALSSPSASGALKMQLIDFIIEFFASKHLTLLTAFLCWPPGDMIQLVRRGQQDGVRVRVVGGERVPPLPAYRTFREGMLLDVGCPAAQALLARATESRAFNLRHSWLLVDEAAFEASRLEAVLGRAAPLPDADVTWAAADALADVYRVKAGRPLLLAARGARASRAQLAGRWRALPPAATRRRDLQNISLNSATIIGQPQYFKGWSDLSNRQIDTSAKLAYPLLMLCAEDLNFRYNMKQVDLYGEESNGTFNGLVGGMQRGELEVGVTSLFMRNDRWRVVHYCAETVEFRGAFLFRQPSRASVSNVFLLPFSGGVWAAGAGASAGAGALLAACGRLLRGRALEPPARPLTALEVFTFTIGAICQQGSDLSPKQLSVRLAMFSSLLASVFAFTSYSAKIVAILQAPSNAIQTIPDLTRSSMTMGVQETAYKKVFFAESTDPATRALFQRKLQPLGECAYLGAEDGIARVRSGQFAFQVEQSSAYDVISRTYTEREKCGLKEIKAFSLPMVAVPLRRHSGYRDVFGARLRWQREVGLMDRAKRVWMTPRPRCEAGDSGAASVALGDVLPAAQALAVGAALAALLLLLERLSWRCRPRPHLHLRPRTRRRLYRISRPR